MPHDKSSLPSLNTVLEDIRSNDLPRFKQSIPFLAKYVDLIRDDEDDDSPLAGIFGEEADNCEVVELPDLDNAFKLHRKQLSIDTILDLIRLSLNDVTEDNYQITLSAIDELIDRKDETAQIEVIKQFKKACCYYDFGHRYWENSVLDQLFDSIFEQFETGALIELLRNGHGDMLHSDGGDQLFAPAFRNCKNETEFKDLESAFFHYQDRNIQYRGFDYFNTLSDNIENSIPDQYKRAFKDEVKQRNEQNKLFKLLESNNPKDIENLIDLLPNKETAFVIDNGYKVLQKLRAVDISYENVIHGLDYFITREKHSFYVAEVLKKLIYPKGIKALIKFMAERSTSENEEYLSELTEWFIDNLYNSDELDQLRSFLKEVKNCSDTEIFSREISSLFDTLTRFSIYEDDFARELNRFEEVIDKVKEKPIDMRSVDLRFSIYLLADGAGEDEWNAIKKITKPLFTVLSQEDILSSFHFSVVAAVETNDEIFFKEIEQYIPENISDRLLTYNLACAYAKFPDKKKLIHYIRESIKLGKSSTQFMEDSDFDNYKNDEDFLKALEENK